MHTHSTILGPKLPETQGFSLLEMVIAMFILALLATTVAQHQAFLLRTQAQQVEQWEAQSRNHSTTLLNYYSP